VKVTGVKVSDDNKKVRIVLDGMRQYYVHKIQLEGVRAATNSWSLVHPDAYYTLNNIPDGDKLKVSELKTTRSGGKHQELLLLRQPQLLKKSTFLRMEKAKQQLQKLELPKHQPGKKSNHCWQKNTCLACHAADKKVVGPSYADVAKRKYTNEKIVN
jgi:hypothetical protein